MGLLSLMNIMELANVLHPDTYRSYLSPSQRFLFIRLRMLARQLLYAVNAHYDLEADEAEEFTVYRLSTHYLFNQAQALLYAKKKSDSTGIDSRIPGFTQDALHAQISAYFGFDIDPDLDTFLWQGPVYRVVRVAVPRQYEAGMFPISM